MSAFICSQCGCCCRKISKESELRFLDRGDGTCRHLENNRCQIYENRPLLCRVDDMYEMFSDMYDLETFYELNYQICKSLQREHNELQKRLLDLN